MDPALALAFSFEHESPSLMAAEEPGAANNEAKSAEIITKVSRTYREEEWELINLWKHC